MLKKALFPALLCLARAPAPEAGDATPPDDTSASQAADPPESSGPPVARIEAHWRLISEGPVEALLELG